jgi:hypothetical protein
MLPSLFTIQETCELLEVESEEVVTMIDEGIFVAVKINETIYIPRNRILTLIESQEKTLAKPMLVPHNSHNSIN